jgi:cytochrome c-type biogenesis protein CcmE
MKKVHIILLVLIAGAIAVLLSFLKTSATYESIAEAKEHPGKFVHVAVHLDKSVPVEFDALKDANYLSFQAIDSTGQTMKVVYRKGEIPNLYNAEKLVLKGKYEDGKFECKDIQTKCPSKYKDDLQAAEKNILNASETPPQNTEDKKY